MPSDHGFTIPLHNTSEKCWVVYYNEKKIMESIRFTLAHELGHIILEHDIDNAINRKEADCFARNLLCPVPLRDELNLTAISDYSQCFNISEYMAEITRGWNKSDKYYISKNNYDIVSWRVYCYFAGYTDKDLYGCVMSELYG